MSSDVKLGDSQVADVLENIAEDLREAEGEDVDRIAAEVRSDLLSLLMLDSKVVVRDTVLQTDGRITFGRENEDVGGVAIFVPESATSVDF